MRILVTGASGYIGGRLVPRLLAAGHEVRCLTRNARKLDADQWRDAVEIYEGDVLEPSTLTEALEGCDVAFYLIHSMEQGVGDFSQRDRKAAENFREAAESADVGRIIYLGGLGDSDDMSPHLSSRQEVGGILAGGSVPVTEFRAAVIIGSGSVSFEMLRYLTEVLPVMITPSWVRTRCQPIAVSDVLDLLADAVETDSRTSFIHEIGGPDQLTYEEMMQVYAKAAGLPKRLIVPVPVLSPSLSSHWIGLVTPLPTGVAKPLVASLKTEVIVDDNSYAESHLGDLIPYEEAVQRALRRSSDAEIATRWSDSSISPARPLPRDPDWAGGTVLLDERVVESDASPDDLFWAFTRIGGDFGYYTMNWAWSIRGLLDSLVGGVGLRRGRRHPEEIGIGESLDFWRVVAIEPGESIQLAADMKLPGRAWLTFEAEKSGTGSVLTQRAVFVPKGLWGRLYWWILVPFHFAIFQRMADKIARAAETRVKSPASAA